MIGSPGISSAGVARILARNPNASMPPPVIGSPGISNAGVARILARNPNASMPPPMMTPDPRMSKEPSAPDEFEKRVSSKAEGDRAGNELGTWGTWVETKLKAGPRHAKNFTTVDAASAWGRALGTPAAVFAEKLFVSPGETDTAVDGFVVYPVLEDSWSSFSRSGTKLNSGSVTSIKAAAGVPVLQFITTDGTVIAPVTDKDGLPNYGGWMEQQVGPKGTDPFGGHLAAFGPGLAGIKTGDPSVDNDKFLKVFGHVLEDTGQSVLNASATKAAQQKAELATGIPDADYATIEAIVPDLLKKTERIDAIEGPLGEVGRTSSQERVEALNAELDRLYTERNLLYNRYPLLTQVDIRAFAKLDREARRVMLQGKTRDVLADIEKTRGNIFGGGIDIWTLGPLVEAALAGLGISDAGFRGAALSKSKWHAGVESAVEIAIGVVQLGLGVAAAVATGPLAIAFAAGALTTGVASAAIQTANYFTDKAAANTDVDKREAMKPGDLSDRWMAVAFAWIALSLDAQVVVSACAEAEKAGISMETAAERFAERLERLPGDLLRAAKSTLMPMTEAAARKILMGGVNSELHAALEGVQVTVVKESEFKALANTNAGEAVTIIGKDSKGAITRHVVVKDTATARSIADEGVHLEQSLEKDWAEKMAKLSAAEANWAKLPLRDQLTTYAEKLEIEINAAERTMKGMPKDAVDYHDYEDVLKDLKKLRENANSALAEKDPEKMAAKAKEWFDPSQPPHLFAKARLPKSYGRWEDPLKPGNCLWYPDPVTGADVLKVTGGKPVPFRNNYPVFDEWARVTVNARSGATMGEADKVWAELIIKRGEQSQYPQFFLTDAGAPLPAGKTFNAGAIGEWRSINRFTWHHHEASDKMLLLSRDLHGNVPHTGGSAIASGSHVPD